MISIAIPLPEAVDAATLPVVEGLELRVRDRTIYLTSQWLDIRSFQLVIEQIGRTSDAANFHEFSARRQNWLASGWLEDQREFRARELADLPPFEPGTRIESVALSLPAADYAELLTAFVRVLAAYSGESEVVVGLSAPNRHRPGSARVIGPVANIVGIRVNCAVADIGEEVRRSLLRALRHQDLPQKSLCSAMFLPETIPGAVWLTPRSNADLTLTIDGFEFNPEVYPPEVVTLMAEHLVHLVATGEMLTDAERRQLAEWNQTALPYRQLPVSELITVTTSLRFEAIEPGSIVGVLLDSSDELPRAILGIWRAGAAYLPLDPSFPPERLQFMLRDSGASALVTQRSFEGRLQAERVFCIEDAVSSDAPVSNASLEGVAAVLYTSGSTGEPKGACITHRNLTNLIQAMIAETGFTSVDTLLAITTISFDAAAMELFLPLVAGGRVVIASRDDAKDSRRLATLIDQHRPSLMFATPATWRSLVQTGWKGSPGLKVLSGGEVLTPELADALLGRCAAVWNGYGPTETTVFSSMYRVQSGEDRQIPIGRAIANTQFHVLDPQGRAVPPGLPGELWIAGDGVSRGYLNRPELTAEKFSSAGWFRTGDRVRFLPDGNLEFLGRLDGQAKVRGNRVEAGEVEAALLDFPGVHAAAVVLESDNLTAYLVSDSAPEPLRIHVAGRLPDFMVPSRFVYLETMPLTGTGKIDRLALGKQTPVAAPVAEKEFVPASTPVEKVLTSIFAEVLQTEAVAADDDFFHLGGHSLLVTAVLSRVTEMWEIELPSRALFDSPTAAALARLIEGAEARKPAPAPAARPERLPLSFAQERLWFLDCLYEADRALYNIPAVLRLGGRFDVAAFKRALNEVIRRHEALRTNFLSIDGQAVQVVSPELTIDVPLVDRASAHAEGARPFDLAHDPLIRACATRIGPGDYELVLVLHHIIADGWSVGVLFREVNAILRGQALPPLPIQYADFTLRERLPEVRLGYWLKQLAGADAVLELPTDRPRSALQTFSGARFEFTLPASVSDGIKELSRKEHATLFMTLLAAFQVLLHRYTGETDICVGSPVANRTRVETEGLIGFFVNTLVLRAQVTAGLGFRELLGSVRDTALDAFAHQDVPFQRIVEELQPERGMSHTPLFQVMFAVQNAARDALEMPGVVTKSARWESDLAKFDLTVNIERTEGAIGGTIEYNTDLFDADRIDRLVGHYATLLASAVTEPERSVGTLRMLTVAEERQIAEWNQTRVAYPQTPLPDLISKTSERVAVECEGHAWSYAELETRANSVAAYLRKHGVQAGALVGIEGERSIELIAGLLGIWKAGSAYVPIDPELPEARRELIRGDAGLRIVLTRDSLAEAMKLSAEPVSSPLTLDSPAYVLYTSGSTGTPKGVVVPHRSLVNFLFAAQRELGFTDSDLIPAIATLSFDIATLELYLPLLAGARAVICPAGVTRDGFALRTLLERMRPTVLQATPATWSMLLEAGWRGGSAMCLLTTGEALPRALANQLLECGARLLNLYGPTETNYSSVAQVEPGEGPVSIGSPLANTQFAVLDGAGQLVPVGVPGELHIAGENVTLGYLNQPALTAERFGEHGFRTGDLVRYRADGELEFLRRLDHQIKLRGYRIEPGEIEAAIGRPCAVLLRNGLLVAYVAADSASEADLRAELAKRLPEYMVPARFVFLDAMPLTRHGKIDRRALPEPGQPEVSDVPHTPLEESMAQIFAEVLGIERVGVNDNFFHLGGHSLLATRVVSRIREQLGLDVTLRTLFEAHTVAGIARRVKGSKTQEREPALCAYVRSREEPVSFAQQRLWFLDRLYEGESPMYSMPQAVLLSGCLDVGRLRAALHSLTVRHETLRTGFREVGGGPVQVIAEDNAVDFEIDDLAESEVSAYIAQEAARAFDLSGRALFRVRLYRLAPDRHVLLLLLHHIISDGWSFGVMFRDLRGLYEGRTPAPLSIQYSDYAKWQREWLSGERLARESEYWQAQMAGAPALLDLPLDRPRGAKQTFAGGNHVFAVDEDLTQQLRLFGRAENVTLFMTLLAGFQLLLARYAGVDDVCVGTPIANRTRVETESLIGFFVNTLVMRTSLSGDPNFRELTLRVRETALQAYAHQELPFEKLVEVLAPDRSPAYPPLFQVLFLLQNASAEKLTLPGLEAQQLPPEVTNARFDLTLAVEERGAHLQCVLNYNGDLFDADRIERMAGHYVTLMAAALAEPEKSAATLPMLTGAEERQIAGWNETAAEYPQLPFPELIAQMPESVAVECQGGAWTYAELNARANSVAAWLREHGVGDGALVGISCERSLEMMAGLLGVWKAGAAYVPIDPDYPEARKEFIRRDAGLDVVLTKDLIVGAMLREAEPVVSELTIDSTAYVLYTSGSTGEPKGVVVPHRSLVNFLFAARSEIGFSYADVIPAIATLSFDIATLELYLPLLAGARVVLAPSSVSRDGFALREFVEGLRPTVLQATPGTWSLLLEAGWHGRPGIRLLSTGEALPRELADRLLACGESLWNLYGPTETNYSSAARVMPGEGPVPIGRPLANTRFAVLDAAGQSVPAGVPGELYISGDNVARGYLNRPELTAEKFGGRGFRTGDLVRYRADGELEFLRRLDHQVKVRGYRIELGEVEAAIDYQCAVILRDGQLIAYVVANDVEDSELRARLERKLPEYMIPSRFVLLDALPLTLNGKIDRRALPAPGERAISASPRTPLEEAVARIFGDVLGLERVGVEDNFFRVGGHSLLATRAVSRIRQEFGMEFALRTIFEVPTVAGLALHIERQQQRDRGPTLRPRTRTGNEPLSFAQERLWFLDRFLEGESPMYNIPEAVLLIGRLDVSRLSNAFDGLIARHETLRTAFRESQGSPVQVIGRASSLEIEVEELDESELASRLAFEAGRVFDLTRPGLLRVSLFRLAPERHVLLFTLHHIVSDGWSLGVLYRDLRILYAGESLPPLRLQYADFAQWQREWLTGGRLERESRYWRERLAGAPPLMELPADRPRPPRQTWRAGNHTFVIDQDLTAALKRYSESESATLFMTLLAGFQALLARYTGVSDVSAGTPIANRTHIETENQIGLFVNMLVIRTELDGEAGFRELTRAVRERTLEAYAHQDLPVEKLVEMLAPERSPAYAPLFQVLFMLQNATADRLVLRGLAVEPVPIDIPTARLDLTLAMEEREGVLACVLNFNSDLFDEPRMARMAGHYTTFLRAAVTDPEKPLAHVALLTPPEEHSFRAWNETSIEYPETTFIETFAHCVAERPDSIAVQSGRQTVTYAELDARANAVALYLREHGVAPEVLVGILVDRSIEMMVGLLGIWKAGGAYVPMDPDYPETRRRFMQEDSGVSIVLSSHLIASLGALGQAPGSGSTQRGLAYVIYTSGSTGQPKGVAIQHGSLINLFEAMRREFEIGPQDVMPALATAAFDMSVPELWLPLMVGARVVLVTRDESRDPTLLREVLESSGATLMQATPTAWNMLLDAGWQPPAGFRLLCGAEALSPGVAKRVAGLGCRAWNLFGPTETCVWSTFGEIEGELVSIGHPIANTRVYVLDEHFQPVPVGIDGELYIAGDGLARGYWQHPELTASKFIETSFEDRLYRTGDVVRWRQDGRLEYIRRSDNQLKLRGFRIEAGEIETALQRHPGVQGAAVVVREDEPGDKRLVAYVVSADVTEDQLRQTLATGLPDYMIPSRFVMLPALPLSANGKQDRSALPRPEPVRGVAPSLCTPTEELIANVFADVLLLDQVTVEDDFFLLGGHSLLATRVVSQVREKLGVEMPLRLLFDEPTVRGLARCIGGTEHTDGGPALRPYARTGAESVSFAQQRLWFLDRYYEGETPMYNIAEALALTGALDVDRLAAAFSLIAARHEALRTSFRELASGPVQVIRNPGAPTLQIEPAQDLQRQLLAEAGQPFDLSTGPLVRATLYRVDSNRHVLLIVMHHIVSDMWSFGVLYREVRAAYNGEALDPLVIQYADFAQWQREWLSGDRLDREVAYWRRQLAGAPPLLELPADHSRPATQTFHAGNHGFMFNAKQTEVLKRFSSAEGATLFMTLLGGFQLLLARYTGVTDICVGAPIANRTRAETEKLIGFFANTLVLRTDVSGTPSFRELLRRVREVTLGAYAHQDLPFEKLVEILEPDRSPAYSPLFQVLIILQNLPAERFTLPGVETEWLPTETSTARFDVTLAMEERDGYLHCQLNYNRDLFDADRMERMAGHFRTLLAAGISNPELPVTELRLLSADEEAQFAVWNQTRGEFPIATFPELFARQAERVPNNIAVECEGLTWTYAELDGRSNAVAQHLTERGACPGVLIGIVVERSLDLMAGLLGIWKAGAAYVPIDPDYPEQRQLWIKQDSGAAIVLTREAIAALGPGEARVSSGLTPDHLAYVIYTSGSTGQPKGVAIRHRSLTNLLECMRRELSVTADSAMLALATAAFDMSVPELWLPLMIGARCVLATREDARDPVRLRDLLERARIIIMQGTPTTWTMLLDQGWVPTENFRLLCGADVLPPALAERIADLPCAGWNMFGPTETCVWSTMARIQGRDVSIGRPLANTQVWVLDEHCQPVPVGVAGELYIGGAGVADGYWNRPELTREKFVALPSGGIVYRTGDLVRWRPDGQLDFAGRSDEQLKLRGYRIEPGEIEAALVRQAGVEAAVAIIREDAPGDKRLVAYVVADAFDDDDLRSALARELPEYMRPSRVVALNAFPLSPNGKIDRRALPAPDNPKAPEKITPRTQLEEIIGEVFAQVLHLSHVDPDENFFHLGGHSLLATSAISRVRTRLNTDVPLRKLFEYPTVSGFAAHIEEHRRDQSGPLLRALPRTDAEPLSFAQQRLWFLDRYYRGQSPMYNIAQALPLSGPLNTDKLRSALAAIVARHEILRTSFHEQDGEPVQVIVTDAPLRFEVKDIAPFELDDHIARETARPFDLAQAGLMRVFVYRIAPERHVLLIVMHHIVSDGWSFGALHRELRDHYEERSVPALPVQYADYARWQREWLSGERLEREAAYWKQQLAGMPALLELPLDRPRPATQTFAAGNYKFSVSEQLTAALRECSQREGATLFMTLLAGFQVLLARYSGATDISVGTPLANRTRVETEGLIGFFANTLVMRTSLADNPGFGQLVERVRQVTLGAYSHQELPFEKMVELLEPERSQSYSPLFQVLFVLQNVPGRRFGLGDAEVEQVISGLETARYDVTLAVEEYENHLDCLLNYNRDLFDADRMERLGGHLLTLLEDAIRDPATRVGDLALLTAAEEQQLREWNRTEAEFPDVSLPKFFLAQAKRRASAVAVEYSGRSLTYSELDLRSNAVAASLRARGVGPETLVGILVERSIEMMIGLLGIWKAGGAYVPIDPEYPEDRQAFMRTDAGVNIVLTGLEIASLGTAETTTETGLIQQNLAYVIYTSGSTGKPKGVAIEHRSLGNLLHAMQRTISIGEADTMLAVATAAFDMSVPELWLPLMTGGQVVLASRDDARDGQRLAELLRTSGATIMQGTPSTWTMLLDAGWAPPPGFRLLCGAEPFPADIATRLAELNCDVWNLFGPTETCVWSTMARVDGGPVTIGYPIANTQVYVLDENRREIPLGVPGELYISGEGVARGYWKRPELTAEKFVVDAAGRRMFRTGDRVRRLADGRLDFVERVDNQVKLRGFRIEPGEIEAALALHPGVRAAAVIIREDQPGDKRLVAYLVGSADLTEAELRTALAARLPDYMIPSRFVLLDALPRSANGKLDRRALPVPDQARAMAANPVSRHPVTQTEEVIANIFCEVLRLDAVGVEDHFFHLGGHSLLAARAMSRIREKTGVDVPLRALFDAPSGRSLARLLERDRRTSDLPPLRRYPRTDDEPVSFAQQRLWFLDRYYEGASPMYNVPQALLLTGPLDIDRLRGSFTLLIARHEILRTTFRQVNGEPVQRIAADAAADFEFVNSSEDSLDSSIALEAAYAFDLNQGPLLRVRVHRLAPDRHALVFVLHHIITDGWSLEVMYRELAALYEGETLAPLPIQYADYAHWQHESFTQARLNPDTVFWRSQLRGAPPLFELPTDRPRPATQTYAAGNHEFAFTEKLTDALNRYSRTQGATLFMTLLAGLQVLLSRYSGMDDISVGTPTAGRNHIETESLIGPFVNTLVMRTDLSGAPSFKEVIGRVRATTLDAYAHQDLPFEKLVEILDPERRPGYTPLFQVLMILHNQPAEPFSLGAVRAEHLGTEMATARFDITLAMQERDGRLNCLLNYNRDLFDAERIVRTAGHFATLLQAAIRQPDLPIVHLPLLTSVEIETFHAWNKTTEDFPQTAFPELFACQAALTPGRTAVECNRQELTYSELDARSNVLAGYLREHGARPETLVGIVVERSLEMMIGLLGIWKAGAAFVPIDPDYPRERQQLIREDSGAEIVLTPAVIAENSAGSAEALPTHAGPEHLAYVIYTSGSTGRPKGVAIPHRSVTNLLSDMRQEMSVSDRDTMLALATAAFDMSVPELWLPLMVGARVVLASREDTRDPSRLRRLLERSRATIMQATPSAWAMLLDQGWHPPSGFRILSGAEALPPWIAERIAKTECPAWNLFGPTETSVWSTMSRIGNGDVTIGRPIANTRVYVVDDGGQLCPVGIPGELCIAGSGVAREYWRQPELTAERFVAGPAGDRMFRTGDRVRWRSDGQLEFIERIDSQVKLRGFRIELGEIEAILMKQPAVEDAAVALQGTDADRQLVAYLVLSAEANEDELREALAKQLPDYMVPARFRVLAARPLSANGKLDRSALPALEQARELQRDPGEPEADDLELRLLGVWKAVLRRDALRVTDNFFALGGHSLQAAKLAIDLERETGMRVPLAVLFSAPSVRQLAKHLRQVPGSRFQRGLAAIQPLGSRTPFFMVEARSMFYRFAQMLGTDQPLFGMPWPDISELSEPYNIPEIATKLITAMRFRQAHGPYVIGAWCIATTVAYEMAQQLAEQGETVEMLIFFDGGNVAARRGGSSLNRLRDTATFYSSSALFHLKRMREMRVWERTAYAAGRAGTVLRHVNMLFWRAAYKALMRGGASARASQHLRDIERVIVLAALDYHPKPYSGRVVYFRRGLIPDSVDSTFGWGDLLPRGLEVYETTGAHGEMFASPHVEGLAAKVTELLAASRGTNDPANEDAVSQASLR